MLVSIQVCVPVRQERSGSGLVAKQLIPKGTSGAVIVEKRMVATAVIPCGDREPRAFADPAQLGGRVAVVDLFPGQQLTKEDFAAEMTAASSRPPSILDGPGRIQITLHSMFSRSR